MSQFALKERTVSRVNISVEADILCFFFRAYLDNHCDILTLHLTQELFSISIISINSILRA